ncbi:MAG TPA: TaqI-like C-terminal specificity domain-containing protein [Chitinophagaceae bacterium]|jgi:hypothetical protein|nr:TaqI-like C-terminal specificity domain-containing protein [Chitinophagaceae bacterium]
MTPITKSPRKALNKAFLKVKPNRAEIESFKTNLIQLLDKIKIVEQRPKDESEEHLKNDIRDFLRDTYFRETNAINTKDKKDLVIHLSKDTNSNVGVIIEAKRPSNTAEMLSKDTLNKKALQELVLYYLRERITYKNLEVKHLIATNINEWFIFDATLFDRLFAQNKNLVKQFNDFESGRLADTKTDFFYNQVARPFIDSITAEIEFTYFNLQDYQKPLRNTNKEDDNSLIALFKLLSPEHLLKLPFTNDSNSLDKRFYTELLHIIGLSETKEGSKKLIGRNKSGERHTGTLLENAIIQLDSLDKLSRLEKPNQFGSNTQERLFNIALELSITWINRILFLKLLEAQLINYHKGDKSYSFLNLDKIKSYDDLNSLFFQVLARKHNERNDDVNKTFERVPYLNSSLFEPTDIEQVTLFISNLKDDRKIPIIPTTVLKDGHGKKRTGNLTTLEYLFEFLNAYDFSSEGSEEIQEDNKTLINASVLGLIFEKINGYKDGSFFTPGFITMYMCRETIRKAVVQKFNETKKWNCSSIEELYDKIEDRKEANNIVNSIKICDPAVGSGHFLVSALNEIIAVKNDLKILQDRNGKRLKEYQAEVVNDELILTDEEGELFEYNPASKESQRIQETLFHEKQTIIENCLFGVDINTNSVKICRLRLWIELLKNAYYKNSTELETLPNIDINIKCGNSLISRFAIDADLKQALKKSKWTIDSYRIAVDTYRNAENKEQKKEMTSLISTIKNDFVSELSFRNKEAKDVVKYRGLVVKIATDINNRKAFGEKISPKLYKELETATKKKEEAERIILEIENNKIFENAFEWRFEFPEVLNDDGDFVGFDVVIGNPPYISAWEMHENDEKQREAIKNIVKNGSILTGHWDLYMAFILLSIEIGKPNSYNTYIIPNPFLREKYAASLRKHLLDEMELLNITLFETSNVFDEVARRTIIYLFKNAPNIKSNVDIFETNTAEFRIDFKNTINKTEWRKSNDYRFNTNSDNNISSLLEKIEANSYRLGNICYVNYGAQVSSKIKGSFKKDEVVGKIKKGNSKKFVEGKDVHRWELAYRNLWLDYRKDEMYGSRFEELFETEKLLTRKISDKGHRVAATFDNNGYYTDDGCVIAALFSSLKNVLPEKTYFGYEVTDQEYDLNFVLSQLLSSIVTFYFKNRFSTESLQGETSHTYPKSVRALPVVNASIEQQKEIASLAKNILKLKNKDVNVDIIEFENEIDKLFYKLYGLSELEIELLEKNINK